MEITEIRIKLMEDSEDRLRAFCSITIDGCFVVRDLKIIDGTSGPFVAMPSRKLSGHCQRCKHKNHLRATYCNHCGIKLQMDADAYDSPQKLYADVAHPINSDCREMIQNAVIEEFNAELERYQQPGYRSRYDDDFEYEESLAAREPPEPPSSGPPRPHFMDRPKREKSSPQDEDDDQFGAGVFS
ncbi:MAG: SpoVG family protein [Pirellulales bacterium]|nr:SpoVG family protein [Pirellulales bacterium]